MTDKGGDIDIHNIFSMNNLCRMTGRWGGLGYGWIANEAGIKWEEIRIQVKIPPSPSSYL